MMVVVQVQWRRRTLFVERQAAVSLWRVMVPATVGVGLEEWMPLPGCWLEELKWR